MGTSALPIPASMSRQILGVRFFTGSAEEAVKLGARGGLVVVPSAPVLLGLCQDAAEQSALLGADLAIADSGLMVLVWRLMRNERLRRVSGLKYTKLLLAEPSLRKEGSTAWVMPSPAARDRNLAWLRSQGFHSTADDSYVAPAYGRGELRDSRLLAWIEGRRPAQIIIALGGCTQERLGFFLRNELTYRPGIHCVGAAIAFLNGDQVSIPKWADTLFLGWLVRCISQPRKFVPRYWRARQLVWFMLRYGEHLPPLAREGHEPR
jgi:UDP-N-acetyl-D-mannosaminuronic acid transferase (WecB/TagA/CpsF family)